MSLFLAVPPISCFSSIFELFGGTTYVFPLPVPPISCFFSIFELFGGTTYVFPLPVPPILYKDEFYL